MPSRPRCSPSRPCPPPHRLALSENVTSGCVLPLWGLPFDADDRLLISDCEHPGVVAACVELARRQGLSIDSLPVKHLRGDQPSTDAGLAEALEQSLTPRTRLVVLSHPRVSQRLCMVIGLPLGITRTGIYQADPAVAFSSSHCRPRDAA